ncbi:MAG: hypothetical protein NZ523_11930, partial [Elioraea sp.]|nr:hypothetical protein [Elioraea sp.]
KASVPAAVTIPAGARSADVTVTLIDDTLVEGTRDLRLTAQAPGHSPGSALVSVLDNDIPALTLAWSAEAVSEGAGRAAAALTITRSLVSAQPLELGLRGDAAQLVFPARVEIAPGDRSVTIPFGVVDNDRVDGNRIALLRIDVLDGVLRVPIPGQTLTTGLQILDDDGPTLRLTLAVGAIGEGGATTATVTRNTGTAGALTVLLSSSDTTEATVPATITIADGADSATFTITGVLDGIPDGSQTVTLFAQAAGFNAGAASLVVTDRELPDLVVRAVTLPESIRTGQTVTGRFAVANQGLGPTRGAWIDRVYLSADAVVSDDDVLVASFESSPLGVGEAYERAFSFLVGQRAREAHLLVVSDPMGALEELSRGNNLGSARYFAAPAYRAIAETAVEMAPAGNAIPITGRVFDAATDAPVAFQPVTVQVTAPGGQVRTLTAFSDAFGRFSVTFRPFANEAGRYRIAADHPGVIERPAQDEFVLLAMSAAPTPARLDLLPNVAAEGAIELRNLADVPLTGLAVTVANAPDWLRVATEVPTGIAAEGRATLRYRITAEQEQAVSGRIAFEIVSAEGARISVPLDLQVVPLTPRLVATPGYLEAGMLRGRQTLVSFEVVNTGGAATGPLTLQLPNEPWLSAATPNLLPSLGVGERTVITLRLNPAVDLPLNPYAGNIVLAGTNVALNVAYRFRAVSEAVGDVVIRLTDEFTFFAEGNPPLAGGRVTLSDPYTGETVATGTSDERGEVRFSNLREGRYAVFATGPKHAAVNTGIDVMPGTTTELELFLRRQAVSYRWTVVPIEVEDRYRIVLETVFETEVPMPVVTVDEPRLMPIIVPGQTTQMQITVRNHGLIQAEQVQVRVPDDPDLVITPLIDVIPVLPAKSAVTIPISIRLREGSPLAAQLAACQETLTVLTGSDLVPLSEVGLRALPQGWAGALAKCLGLETIYRYECRGGQWVSVPVSLNPLFCGEDVYGAWGSLREWISDPTKANAASLGCDVIGMLMQCLGADDCVQAVVSTLCNVGGGALFGGAVGAGIGLVDALSDILGGLCSLGAGGGGGSGGGEGGGGWFGWWFGGGDVVGTWNTPIIWQGPPVDCRPGPSDAAGASVQSGTPSPTEAGVCAQVRLRLEQEAVITRTAFLGTLELDNGSGRLEDVRLLLDIRDAAGGDANEKFIILGPDASGFGGGPDAWTLGPNASGALRYTFIPAVGAATDLPERYRIGGKLFYRENGTVVELPLLPATITVFPEAKLVLDYFWQRDVIGDDPFTDEIEPSEPFVLGLQVANIGKGDANRMTITSAQPQIIENEKGLLIDFKIIGSQVGANPGTNSLTIDLGRIAAGETRTAKWEMISTLQGKFVEYKATFEHLDSFGGRRTSLIERVNIHELIRKVRVNHPSDDRIPDFLVNDIADPDHL